MKTENTLRTVRNSLLCFFTALGAGFLVACGGGGGGGTSTFSTYLTDASVEGAEYSGPTSSDVTGEDGVFTASEGVFEFSVGATTLGSVQLNSNWADSHVTPADFIGVDTPAEVVSVARIVQGLDNDGIPGNGISISQSVRDGLTVDLFTRLTVTTGVITVSLGAVTLTIPPTADASAHLIATRQCLYSGGYMGDYRSTVASDSPEQGRNHFVFDAWLDDRLRVGGVKFTISSDGSRGDPEIRAPYFSSPVGVRGSEFAFIDIEGDMLAGNELTFVTPRLVTGIWAEGSGNEADSGTFTLTRVADDPTANRRVVGVEIENRGSGEDATQTPVGIYVLNYTADGGEFRGQYYDAETNQYSDLLLTVADGSEIEWPTLPSPATMMLTLSGMLGEGDTDVTIGVTRDGDSDTRGEFSGSTGANRELDGSWCDLRTTTTAAIVSEGALVESLAMSHSRIGGDVSAHRLSRYLDSGFPANTAIEGVQILG